MAQHQNKYHCNPFDNLNDVVNGDKPLSHFYDSYKFDHDRIGSTVVKHFPPFIWVAKPSQIHNLSVATFLHTKEGRTYQNPYLYGKLYGYPENDIEWFYRNKPEKYIEHRKLYPELLTKISKSPEYEKWLKHFSE